MSPFRSSRNGNTIQLITQCFTWRGKQQDCKGKSAHQKSVNSFETGKKSNLSGFILPLKTSPPACFSTNSNFMLQCTIWIEWKLSKLSARIHFVKEAHLACSTIGQTEDKAEDCSSYSTQLKVDDLAVQVAPGGYVITSTREDSFWLVIVSNMFELLSSVEYINNNVITL